MEEAFLGLYNVQLKFRFRLGKFILYANIPYLYPHTPNHPQQAWGTVGNRGFFWREAYVSDIWPLKNLGEFP